VVDSLFFNLIWYFVFNLFKNVVFMFFFVVLYAIAIKSKNMVLLVFILELVNSIAKSVFWLYLFCLGRGLRWV